MDFASPYWVLIKECLRTALRLDRRLEVEKVPALTVSKESQLVWNPLLIWCIRYPNRFPRPCDSNEFSENGLILMDRVFYWEWTQSIPLVTQLGLKLWIRALEMGRIDSDEFAAMCVTFRRRHIQRRRVLTTFVKELRKSPIAMTGFLSGHNYLNNLPFGHRVLSELDCAYLLLEPSPKSSEKV